MAIRARDHVLPLTAVVSVASLALVFGAVLGAIPVGALPRAPRLIVLIPHINVGISLLAIGTIVAGWRAIRRGQVRRHRAAMLLAVALFAAFLVLYLYRVALEGPSAFSGPGAVYRFVYLPILGIHVLLAVVCIPLLSYVLLVGLTHPVEAIPSTAHPHVGRIAAALWLVSFGLGSVVYLLLYAVY